MLKKRIIKSVNGLEKEEVATPCLVFCCLLEALVAFFELMGN